MTRLTSKGVSPIISSVAMIAVAIIATLIAYFWGSGVLTASLESVDTSGVSAQAQIEIDSIDVKNEVIYVRCKGDQTDFQTVYVTISVSNTHKIDVNSRPNTVCNYNDKNVLDVNLRVDSRDILSTGVDLNDGYKVEIRGTNDARSIKTA
ncbi:MAG TPA: hypothetical protein VJI67_03145 [archaeon]|nr:hypothetical protein [archaeon]HLD81505.1 hypothetical protein [archaeon]